VSMGPDYYRFFEELLKRECGLVVTPEQSYLFESRILPVAFRYGLDGLPALALRLRTAAEPELLREVVEAMAAGETSFFRDRAAFTHLKDAVLPGLMERRTDVKKLRFWSAACASGQEAYSLAILLKELGPALAGWSCDIVATDLSLELLDYAKAGVYTQTEVQHGLPVRCLVKYFTQEGEKWQLVPEIAGMVRFGQANLLGDFSALGLFDVILCRNVLSGFDLPTRMKTLHALRAALRRDGTLYLGAEEEALNILQAVPGVPGAFRHAEQP
jgi:chemotaxis protein methyltransferase CheR